MITPRSCELQIQASKTDEGSFIVSTPGTVSGRLKRHYYASLRYFPFAKDYTVCYSLMHRLNGQLFQGRYNAVIVDLESRRYTVTLLLAFHRSKLLASCEDMLVRVHAPHGR